MKRKITIVLEVDAQRVHVQQLVNHALANVCDLLAEDDACTSKTPPTGEHSEINPFIGNSREVAGKMHIRWSVE